MSRLGDYLNYPHTAEETIEATLAFILIDLEGISSKPRFTLEQEDQLLAIEKKVRELRNKL